MYLCKKVSMGVNNVYHFPLNNVDDNKQFGDQR